MDETRQGWYERAYWRGLDGFRSNAENPSQEGEGSGFIGVLQGGATCSGTEIRRSSRAYLTLSEIEQYFSPLSVRRVPLFRDEVLGIDRLRELARSLYAPDEDPLAVTRDSLPFSFVCEGDHYEVWLDLPFTEKAEIGLFKKEDELVVEVGTNRRHIGLPTMMANLTPVKARLAGRKLVVEMR